MTNEQDGTWHNIQETSHISNIIDFCHITNVFSFVSPILSTYLLTNQS
jgi:hypothetical protein